MLDELLGEWLDKRKAKKELLKAYKLYKKKKESYLCANTIEIYEQLQDIQYAIAYVLCEYFDLKHGNANPYSIQWDINYDYTKNYESCKEAYIKFVKENESSLVHGDDIMYVMGTDDLQKTVKKIYGRHSNHAHMIYDIEHDYIYWKDKHENIWKRC